MQKQIAIRGCTIEVGFEEHAVHITNDKELARLLDLGLEPVTDELVDNIRSLFQEQYQRDFEVTAASLAVEIWGHVYFESLMLVLDKLVQLKLIQQVTSKMISYCRVIDCGEPGYDNNRLLWDMLAPFKSRIAGWLPDKIAQEQEEE